MRLFFALEPTETTLRGIAEWRQRQYPALERPVPVANLHLTLAFLGELPAAKVESLCSSVDSWVEDKAPLADRLHLDQVGYWPKPGILWLGPTGWPASLDDLAGKLGKLGAASGGQRERRSYRPHITLFRRCARPPPAPMNGPDLAMAYDHFALVESLQGRRGVSYQPLAAWPLAIPQD